MLACMKGNAGAARALLVHGANVEQVNADGKRAADYMNIEAYIIKY